MDGVSLRDGSSKSCGCLRVEAWRRIGIKSRKRPTWMSASERDSIKRVKEMSGGYLRYLINSQGIDIKNITPEMVGVKRQSLLLKRKLKEMREEL